jgi:hypothetical protein
MFSIFMEEAILCQLRMLFHFSDDQRAMKKRLSGARRKFNYLTFNDLSPERHVLP